MPRSISFHLTERAFVTGEKDVTRRLGWLDLTAGQELRAVRKAMGLRKGERQVELGTIRVKRVTRERLDAITADDVRREGFPTWAPADFVAFFAKANKCDASTLVTRIEFERLP